MKETLHIYTRVSSDIQTKGNSLSDQKETGLRISEQYGMKSKIWNEGGKSSKVDSLESRVVLYELFKEVSKGKIKHLFFMDLTRGMRTDYVKYQIKKECIQNGVTLYTKGGVFKFDSPQDRLFYDMISSFGVYDNEIRREKSIIGKISGMKKGNWKGGSPNWGYDLLNKKLIINKEEKPHLIKMFEMYNNGKSVKEIQKYCLKNNLVTRKGNKIFSLESIRVILTNTMYLGYKDMSITDFKYRFECPPIIDEGLFWNVQEKIKELLERKNQINRTTHNYLLRNYLYCNQCNNGLSGVTRETRGYLQENYFCSNRTRLWKGYKNGTEKCKMKKTLNIPLTDFVVWETICDVMENSVQLKDDFKKTTLDMKFKSKSKVNNEIRRIRHRIKRISRGVNDLNENILIITKNFYTNKMDEKTFKEVELEIKNEIEKLESERQEYELLIGDTLQKNKWLSWIEKYSKKITKLRDTDIDTKKDIVGRLLKKINVDFDEKNKHHILDIRLKLPLFNDKIEYNDESNKSKGYKVVNGKNSQELRFKRTNNPKKFIDDVKKKTRSFNK